MAKITQVYAREILDSRSIPTIEAVVMLDTGTVGVASAPSGTSTGKYEAVELRDNDPARHRGKGVLRAVSNVNRVIGPAIVGMEAREQFAIDQKILELDGTENKSNLGANAILAVSMAVCKTGAISSGLSLYQWVAKLAEAQGIKSQLKVPTPVFNLINGGMHGAGNLDFQEFQVIPASAKPYSEGYRGASEVYHFLEDGLARRGAIHSVGDEGGYAPNLFTNADALEIIVEAISEAGYEVGRDFFLGLDVAADSFYKDGAYPIKDDSQPLDRAKLIEFYEKLNKSYRLTYLEDPLEQDDWDGWKELTGKLGDKLMVVGDDVLATNLKRVARAVSDKTCNAALIKPNQDGSISETLAVIKTCRDASWKVVVSHRSGETNDWFIADFAVGVGADYVKFGAPARGERVAKYNRLLSIEAELKLNNQ